MNQSIPPSWNRVRLVEPSTSGFVYVGISTGSWPIPPALPSRTRRRALASLRQTRSALIDDPRLLRCDVFRGTLRPPGASRGFQGQSANRAAYDAVLLIETVTPGDAQALAADPRVATLGREFDDRLIFAATNVRRINPVDHDRPGVFLFNYFSADDVASNLEAWQYTAGWFQDETNLDNSTVLEPAEGSPYTLVNHCRWDHYADVVPDLLGKRSFRDFVLRTFESSRVAPRPVLYSLAN